MPDAPDTPIFRLHVQGASLSGPAVPRRRIGEDLDDETVDERIDPPDQIVPEEDDEDWDSEDPRQPPPPD
jgi:hypothetical protein